jgi:hypothetical protein
MTCLHSLQYYYTEYFNSLQQKYKVYNLLFPHHLHKDAQHFAINILITFEYNICFKAMPVPCHEYILIFRFSFYAVQDLRMRHTGVVYKQHLIVSIAIFE